jgi:hypothetical protein
MLYSRISLLPSEGIVRGNNHRLLTWRDLHSSERSHICATYLSRFVVGWEDAASKRNRQGTAHSIVGRAEQIVGRERRERVSHHNWSGDA